jgi:hypothetical protein
MAGSSISVQEAGVLCRGRGAEGPGHVGAAKVSAVMATFQVAYRSQVFEFGR